jgi:hypothetical protein
VLDLLQDYFPEATRQGVEFIEDYRKLDEDRMIAISHSYTGWTVAPSLARLIFFAHAVYDLEKNNVENFDRVKPFCTKEGLKHRPFERTYYEIVIAARFARRDMEVKFVQEGKLRSDKGKAVRTPDLLVLDRSNFVSIECKSNVFRDLDSIQDQNLRTKRAIDRLLEGYQQIEEYGEATSHHGIVLVQYFDNTHIEEDKEYMRALLIDEMQQYKYVEGGGFTYDVFNLRSVHAVTNYFGAVKDGTVFSRKMLRTFSFQDEVETIEWTESSFQ